MEEGVMLEPEVEDMPLMADNPNFGDNCDNIIPSEIQGEMGFYTADDNIENNVNIGNKLNLDGVNLEDDKDDFEGTSYERGIR